MATFKLTELRARLEEMGISPKKSLGQNFLINGEAIDKIVGCVERLNPTGWIEIGPGLGALTDSLQKMGAPLYLLELDKKFCDYWRTQVGNPLVVEGDALQLDWNALQIPDGSVLVSNLPYQISASLVVDRSLGPVGITAMVLMFQKEVAQRILARVDTDDYGFLSVMAQTYWEVRHVLEVSSKDFFPPPAVASRVVEFRRKVVRPELMSESFLKFVKCGFAHRRKLLAKNLEASFERSRIEAGFAACELAPLSRAENLSPAQFVNLYCQLAASST